MTGRRLREPGLWLLFSAGGTLAALFLPVLAAVLWVAPALGWLAAPAHDVLAAAARSVAGRLFLTGLIVLALFHWAHRFRYTLYDGLQLYHLNQLIAVLTYGVATVLSVAAGVVVWR
ncbi:MAG: fumarate reductase subunit D [Gemmatimonadetes bacterium]|nr:fumarate reductase subunit D [Gemmatimonadota bacterium]